MVPPSSSGASGTAASRPSISILVADDQAIVRRGIALLLKLTPEFIVAGEADNGIEAVERALELQPDIVLMDIAMPLLNGFGAAVKIKAAAKQVKIVMLSALEGEEHIVESIASGADGFILKKSPPECLAETIRTVARTRSAFTCPSIPPERVAALAAQAKRIPQQEDDLTPRERDVMQMIVEGRTHEEIAEVLNVSVRTVDTHRNNLMQKLDIHDAITLVRLAVKKGLVQL